MQQARRAALAPLSMLLHPVDCIALAGVADTSPSLQLWVLLTPYLTPSMHNHTRDPARPLTKQQRKWPPGSA
jgi:hypothetical protein